jgi:hypothetical protein
MTVENVVYDFCINCILFQSCKALFETSCVIQSLHVINQSCASNSEWPESYFMSLSQLAVGT